jgi:formylglycine-generating enzyme required for sulfatase activity
MKKNMLFWLNVLLFILYLLSFQGSVLSMAEQKPASENMPGKPAENMIKIGNFYMDQYEFPNKLGELPVTDVTWEEAAAMCTAVGKRLCTPEEWTLACRGPQGLRYMYSQEYNGTLCNSESTIDAPQKIGSAPATCVSGYGIHDLLGNVWEWVGASSAQEVAIRGGAWSSSRCAECALKFWEGKPATKSNRAGFRCCK